MRKKRCCSVLLVLCLLIGGIFPTVCTANGFGETDFLLWNRSDMGWSQISRNDPSRVTRITVDEEIGVYALACVGQTVYAVDSENCLFRLDAQTYGRVYIGKTLEGDFSHLYEGENYRFVVRDMAFDTANHRMLVLGAAMVYDDDYDYWEDIHNGCSLYELDLSNGKLTPIHIFKEYQSVYAIAVDAAGLIYCYTVENDHIYRLNLQSGQSDTVVSLEDWQLYGEYGYDIRHGLCYDYLSEGLYLILSTDRNHCRMVTIDPETGAVTTGAAESDRLTGLAIPFTLPGAPEVTAFNTPSTGKVRLTWNAVEGAVQYRVYRATSKNGRYTAMFTTSGTSYTNTKAEAERYYYYYVVAISENGAASAPSNTVGRTCNLPRPVVTASNAAKSGKPKLTWNRIDGAVSYRIYRATKKDGTYRLMYTTDGTAYINTMAASGATYYYQVVAAAKKSAANSAPSAVASRTCDLPQPKLTGKVTTGGSPKLTWEPIAGAVQYKVYRAESGGGTYKLMKTLTGTSYTNTNHSDGKRYNYYVVAVADKTAANSAKSNIVKLTAK